MGADPLWGVVLVATVLLLVGAPRSGRGYEDLEVGQTAPRDIKALEAFNYPDRTETARRQQEAKQQVPDVYVYDTDRGSHLAGQLSSVFQQGRTAIEQAALEGREPAELAAGLFRDRIPPSALHVLLVERFDPGLERELSAALKRVMAAKIVTNKASLQRGSAITLAPIRGERQLVDQFDEFIDLNDARSRMRQELARGLDLPRESVRALGELADSFVDADVYFDRETTGREREDAALAVRTVYTRVERSELLVHEGRRLTEEDFAKLETARSGSTKPYGAQEWVGLVLLASLLAFFVYRYSHYHQRAFRKLTHLHALLVSMLVATQLLSEAILWLARRTTDNLGAPFNRIDVYPYLVPLGAGAMLVALLANGRIATVYSAFGSLLFGAVNGWNAYLMLWAMLVQCAGVYAVSTYRDRAALLRAGLVVGGVGAVAALALDSLQSELGLVPHGVYAAAVAFVGGTVGVGLLISSSLPLLEKLFHVLTDIRLLELSNVNSPLLSELAVKAPGSYNHSLVVGTLAEEAAKAIGANSLFCRVAAFYHDIGKIHKPEYFVENQRGVNPHDRLAPSMSALIIASHVKDGIRIAREAGLPEQIIDIIPQHHGTKLMTYFYEKARRNADPSLGPVQEEDFRYPGPKPQTREAAIFMLADAVEAAARTVDEPTPRRLVELIRKVSDTIVLDGELDACELTFADLTRIREAFLRCLVSMYHHRVDYPGFDFRRPQGTTRSGTAESRPAEFRGRSVARGT